ncbi:MAG: GNAT family N-acetyltransferase [Ilumatobacteraceae bacterium]
MDHFVRLATGSDVDSLRLLESEARAQFAHFRGGDRLGHELPLVDDRWVERIGSDDWLVLVAGFDDVPLGYLCANMATASAIPLVENVYVSVDVRQLGLGDGLVSAAIDACHKIGAVAIDAFALPGDRETKNLFERSGLTARLLIVSKRLDG